MVNRSSGILRMRPRWAFWFCGAAVLLALGWGASWTVAERQFQAGLKKARADIRLKAV